MRRIATVSGMAGLVSVMLVAGCGATTTAGTPGAKSSPGVNAGQNALTNTNQTANTATATPSTGLQPTDKFDSQGLVLPIDNEDTRQAVLAALNTFLEQHWTGPGKFRTFRPQDVKSGPAVASDYAQLIENTYGEDAVRYSWWIATGEPGTPFKDFSVQHPALVENYYLVNRHGTWEVWYQYP